MAAFTIREATPDDAEQILAHVHRIADEPDNGIILSTGERIAALDEERQMLAEYQMLDNAIFLVAEVKGRIIGVCNARGGKRLSMRHTAGIGITVAQEWRNRGVGTALMQALINWSRGTTIIRRLELEVFADNDRAIHVYQKLGFEIEGRKRQAYLKDGQYKDSLVMALLLES